MSPSPCTLNMLKYAVQSESRFCRFLLHCGFLRRRVGLAVASPSSAALVRSVCTARDRRALRTRRPVHNLGPKSPITGWLSLCFLILCTRVQMTSHAGSARSQRPRPPGPRLRRLSAHRTTSARARLHKPSDLAPSALGRSPFVVGPRAVFADPLAPTGTLLVASMAVVNYHLDLAPLGVRHALSNPRIHVSRACVSVPPPTLPWPIRRPCPHCVCRRIADCVPASPIFVAGLPPPGALPPRPLACSAESGRAVGAGRRAAQPGPRSGHPVVRQPRWPLSGTGAPRAVCISSPVTLPAPSGGVWGVGEVRNVDLSPRCPYCDHLYHCSAIFTVTVCFLKTWFTRAILVLSQATVDAISQLDIGPPILAEHHIWPRMLARATNMQNYTAGTRAHDSCMALDWPSPSGRWMNVSNTGDNDERQRL